MNSYVLDTSALLAFRNREPGEETVASILRRAAKKEIRALISFVTVTEIFYLSWQRLGKEKAYHVHLQLMTLPLERIDANEKTLLVAGELKAAYPVSLADAYIAALAMEHHAILVHKDPDYESLGERIVLKTLPYKTSRKL